MLRTVCKACEIIGDDMEMIKNVHYHPIDNEDLVDQICATLGYNHKPYNWLEDMCDEMTEEHAGM